MVSNNFVPAIYLNSYRTLDDFIKPITYTPKHN